MPKEMAPTHTVTVLEHYQVPPQGSAAVAQQSLPITFFDVLWIYMYPIERIVFYENPISTSHFIHTVIPKFRNSLSLALKHFLPLAGNLIVPTDSSRPEIRYSVGDSVSLIFAESTGDFENLTANHARSTEEFRSLVPQLPEAKTTADSLVVPLLALQVTLFPNIGFSLGIINHHSVGDACAIFNFMRAWASICKFDGDDGSWLSDDSLPLYDRNLIKDPSGLWALFLRQSKELVEKKSLEPPSTKDNVRATFTVDKAHIQRLKHLVSTHRPNSKHVSTFSVVCGYVWTCIVKSRVACGETVQREEDELDYFGCAADCRSRLDTPIPATYFGNCLTYCSTAAKTNQIIEEGSYIMAAGLIGDAIRRKLYEEGPLKDAEGWLPRLETVDLGRLVGVAGSPKYNYYELDFGWGKGKKFEFISIDSTGSISMSGSRDCEGDIEVGLSLPKPQMDVFTGIFIRALEELP